MLLDMAEAHCRPPSPCTVPRDTAEARCRPPSLCVSSPSLSCLCISPVLCMQLQEASKEVRSESAESEGSRQGKRHPFSEALRLRPGRCYHCLEHVGTRTELWVLCSQGFMDRRLRHSAIVCIHLLCAGLILPPLNQAEVEEGHREWGWANLVLLP